MVMQNYVSNTLSAAAHLLQNLGSQTRAGGARWVGGGFQIGHDLPPFTVEGRGNR